VGFNEYTLDNLLFPFAAI